MAGYGKRKNDDSPFKTVLRKIDIPIFPDDRKHLFTSDKSSYWPQFQLLSLSGKCEKRVRDAQRRRGDRVIFNVLPAEFCAGGEIGHDSCKGDGGAPLVCEAEDGRWHVVGLGKYPHLLL